MQVEAAATEGSHWPKWELSCLFCCDFLLFLFFFLVDAGVSGARPYLCGTCSLNQNMNSKRPKSFEASCSLESCSPSGWSMLCGNI